MKNMIFKITLAMEIVNRSNRFDRYMALAHYYIKKFNKDNQERYTRRAEHYLALAREERDRIDRLERLVSEMEGLA